MKQREIQQCANCGEGLAKDNVFFYRIRIEQMAFDFGAIRRQHGLEMMMGAAAPLAQVMGPDEDLAKGLGAHDVMVCGNCGSLKELVLHNLIPSGAEA